MDTDTENLILMGMTGMMSDPIVKDIIASKLITSNDPTKKLIGAEMYLNSSSHPMPTLLGGVI